MDSESQKERQKMLQRERQKRHRQLKSKENVPPCSKWRIEIDEPVMTARACDLTWIRSSYIGQYGLWVSQLWFVYPNFSICSDPKYFVDREILAPTNEHVNISINSTVITQFPGEAVEEGDYRWPPEFLNFLLIS